MRRSGVRIPSAPPNLQVRADARHPEPGRQHGRSALSPSIGRVHRGVSDPLDRCVVDRAVRRAPECSDDLRPGLRPSPAPALPQPASTDVEGPDRVTSAPDRHRSFGDDLRSRKAELRLLWSNSPSRATTTAALSWALSMCRRSSKLTGPARWPETFARSTPKTRRPHRSDPVVGLRSAAVARQTSRALNEPGAPWR